MKRQEIDTYEKAVEYLLQIPRFTSKHSLEATAAFLHELGDPDRGLKIVHVAGTNGKGSVCAYLRSILEAAGRRVGVFTSPHLVDIRERFLLEGRMPSREEFLRLFLTIYDRLDWKALGEGEGYHPTFFEYLFFMAMLYFAEGKPDYCILETGLGGRLDATNSVSCKELAVLTRISLDHVEYLGHDLGAIAGEKAGIMRAGTPAVYLDEVPEASAVFEKRAEELQISAYPVSKQDYTILKNHHKTIDFSCGYRYHKNIPFRLHTLALYQVENAALALRAAEVLEGEKITVSQLQKGIAEAFWAGRMEEILPEVYVDGAHNEDGIRAFVETVAQDGWEDGRRLLFGAVADKDYGRMLEELVCSGLFSHIGIVHLKSARSASLEELRGALERYLGGDSACQSDFYPDCRPDFYENVASALTCELAKQGRERLYIAGSLYLVGEVKELADGMEEGHDQF